MNLEEKAFELIKHLNFEGIIDIDHPDIFKDQTCEDIVLLLRQKLQETYPQTKLKRMMKSVHFANGFSDEGLKQVALILTDEVDQYLTINKFLDHDISVEYFNNKITSAGFAINPTALVGVMLESLLISKGKK